MTTRYDTPPLEIGKCSDLSDWDEGEARAHGWPEALIAEAVHEIGRRERLPNSEPRDFYQPPPADIRAARANGSNEMPEQIPAAHEAAAEIARLTRELREWQAQSGVLQLKLDSTCAERDIAWQAQTDLIECRDALRNSEACRAQAENASTEKMMARREVIALIQERDAARQDAERLADALTTADNTMLIADEYLSDNGAYVSSWLDARIKVKIALTAHAQAVTQ